MTIDLAEDFKTATEVKAGLRQVLSQVHTTHRPVVITVKGKPDAVILGVEDYERQRRSLELLNAAVEGERDVREGRVRPAREVLEELDGAVE